MHGACLCKDILQTFQLFSAVGKDAEAVALLQVVFQRLLQEVEILMELRLWRNMEFYSILLFAAIGDDAAEGLHLLILQEIVSAH